MGGYDGSSKLFVYFIFICFAKLFFCIGDFRDVWKSSNGITWTIATSSASWSGRDSFPSVVVNNLIFIFGGKERDESSLFLLFLKEM